ncbi:MAG: DUF4190 domain-containing protein [Phycisphaerales bacterium]
MGDREPQDQQEVPVATARRAGAPVAPAPPVSQTAVASLVCALLFCIPLIPSTVAVLLGVMALRTIRASGGRLAGDGQARLGIILGVAGLFIQYVSFSIFVTNYQDSLQTRIVTAVEQTLNAPENAIALHWDADNVALEQKDIAQFAQAAIDRYGALQRVQLTFAVTPGSTRILSVPITYYFARGSRVGGAEFLQQFGFTPILRLRSLEISDPERGDLRIPVATDL